MEDIDPTCDAVQAGLSAAMDGGERLPDAWMRHARHCSECAAFLEAWGGGLDEMLAGHVPPPLPELCEKILLLPVEARASRTDHRFRNYLSAAAAVVVLGVCGSLLLDVRPAGSVASAEPSPADRELAAIKSDLRRGLAFLGEPTGAVKHTLAP